MNKFASMLKMMGLDLKSMFLFFYGLPFYFRDFIALKRLRGDDKTFKFEFYPVLGDKYSDSGVMSGHYFHQDLLVARKIFESQPKRHIDIGSRVDGFVAHLASFREVEVVDIRPQTKAVKNIRFTQIDLFNLPIDYVNQYDSVSCLHALEHFGLGRYGDNLDYHAYKKGLEMLTKMLCSGGKLYLSVPIGPQRIEFNAHRVFSVRYLLDIINCQYTIVTFSYVDDQGNLLENVDLLAEKISKNFGCNYGCGVFELIKK